MREPKDKNLNLQVERLVRTGCAMENTQVERVSGTRDDRGILLERLVQGFTLVVTRIEYLSMGLRPTVST